MSNRGLACVLCLPMLSQRRAKLANHPGEQRIGNLSIRNLL
jgi:hypothetical protein